MGHLFNERNTLVWKNRSETVRLEAWGNDSIRVTANSSVELQDNRISALIEADTSLGSVSVTLEKGTLVNGKLKVSIDLQGKITFINTKTNEVILEELVNSMYYPTARVYAPITKSTNKIEVNFKSDKREHIYGLGQHANGCMDQKGCVIDLLQYNAEVAIPFFVSSKGYGFLWNNPAVGRVELGMSLTRWVAEESGYIDYWVTAGNTYAEILEKYADATGHAPILPEWAAGLWQSKLRYSSQIELLEVAREHKKRGIPLSVIVVDFFHWTAMGDWKFDSRYWPDPAAMVEELEAMGVKVMISVWPAVNMNSSNYDEMLEKDFLIKTLRGNPSLYTFTDSMSEDKALMSYYDATNPEARKYVWNKLKENYLKYGIKVWWLDACEPNLESTQEFDNLVFDIGSGLEVGCIYPLMNQKMVYEGMKEAGEEEIVLLSRSAWAGSQKYGAAVWSGDTFASFETLRNQIKAGLNICMSGIPWWTTDIGGFVGGDPATPSYRELLIRWFQYGAFCPLFRMHGLRVPLDIKGGGPNEIWSYGEQAYEIMKQFILIRERMKPYIMEQMRLAHYKGTPVMRPLFFDFEGDCTCYDVEDEFMFGPELLIAPITFEGKTNRKVYLPMGSEWIDAWSGQKYKGGQEIDVEAPLEIMPIFLKSELLRQCFETK